MLWEPRNTREIGNETFFLFRIPIMAACKWSNYFMLIHSSNVVENTQGKI